ncbi:MAG: hypothetical protein GX442_10410 [Candidatus Riflebacteria bacterium]|nr:hypothetical protein [Candidatus Riflebacteria bacterium]
MRKNYMALFTVVILLGVVMAVGCGGGGGGGGDATSPVAPVVNDGIQRADLSGTVTYLGNVVPNATVYLLKEATDTAVLSKRAAILGQPTPDTAALTADGNGFTTTTNANGQYLFSQVPVGNYTLTALADPVHQISMSVIVGAITNLDLALKPTGTVSGIIKDTYGEPAVGYLVYLSGTSYVGVTSMDGSFTIMNVPISSAPYTLLPAYQTSYAFKNSPVTVTVVAGANTSVGTIEMIYARGGITGFAYLPGATDHSGISVYCDGRSGTTDVNGSFTIGLIGFGQNTVSYSKYYNGEYYTGMQVITVNSLATATIPNVTLAPQSANTAKIDVTLDGLFSTGGTVYWRLYRLGDSSYYDSDYTTINATFSYSGLSTGTWQVVFTPVNSNYTLSNPAAGTTDRLASITVTAGGYATSSAVFSYKYSSLSGSVSGTTTGFTDTYSNPLTAELWRNGYSWYSAPVSGGAYSFSSSIATGVWSLVLSGAGYETGSQTVILNPGANTQNLTATPTFPTYSSYSLSGNVLTVTGTRFDVSTASLYIVRSGLTTGSLDYDSRTATTLVYDMTPYGPAAYSVYVQGEDGARTTSYANVSIPFSGSPTITSNVTTDVGTSTYALKWNNSFPGAASFTVRGISPAIAPVTLGQASSSYTFTGLNPDTTYQFGIVAKGFGISDSTESTITVTTKKVFTSDPTLLDTKVACGSFRGSQAYAGTIYSVVYNVPNYSMVTYNLTTGATSTATLVPPSGADFNSFHVNGNLYVVWKDSQIVTVQRFALTDLTTPTNSYATTIYTGSYGAVYGGRIATDTSNNLKILTWGMDGNTSGVFRSQITTANSTLGSPVETTGPLTNTTNDGNMIFTPVKGSSGQNYYAMSYQGSGSPEYQLYQSDLTTLEDSASLVALKDLTPSPVNGLLIVDSTRSYFLRPPNTFGFSISNPGSQAAIDDKGKMYFYESGPLSTLNRYSSTGSFLDSRTFYKGFTPTFGEKCITFDLATQQVLVAVPISGNLAFVPFTTVE